MSSDFYNLHNVHLALPTWHMQLTLQFDIANFIATFYSNILIFDHIWPDISVISPPWKIFLGNWIFCDQGHSGYWCLALWPAEVGKAEFSACGDKGALALCHWGLHVCPLDLRIQGCNFTTLIWIHCGFMAFCGALVLFCQLQVQSLLFIPGLGLRIWPWVAWGSHMLVVLTLVCGSCMFLPLFILLDAW